MHEIHGRIWSDLMDLLGVQQVLTSPYYPQGNGIVERSHRTIHNLLRAHLSSQDDNNWVDLLPGVMLTFNEMTQDHHGFTASQILWGQSLSLPVDLIHGEPAKGSRDTGGYVKGLQKRLWEIRRAVAPFNKQQVKPMENPFKVGELILIFQQPMEREHKLSPKWRGPFPITKIETPFQVCYDDRGREKVAQVRHCKKFIASMTSGQENYVTSSNDITKNDSWIPKGGRPGGVEEACDLLTPSGRRPIGSTKANSQKQKKRGKNFRCHALPRRRWKMLLSHIEVCFQGSVLAFKDILSFVAWVNSAGGSSKVIGIRGVGGRHGHRDLLLSHFVTLELHMQGPPGCWQRRRIGYLQKQCVHRPTGREAVKRTRGKEREAGKLHRPVEEGVRRVSPSSSDVSLQEAPPTAMTSEADGYISDPQGQ